MKKKQIFDNEEVGALLKEYSHDRKNVKLRNRIVRRVLPLIEAALSKKHIWKHREDLRQECALKVLKAIPKYNVQRGKPFAFFWTTICNVCISQGERLSRPSLSLSSDEDVQREAEVSSKELFQTPENQLILSSISEDLHTALFSGNGFKAPRKRVYRKAAQCIQASITSGDLFVNRGMVIRKLKRIGLEKKEIQYYTERSLVVIRQKLLNARENSHALADHKNRKVVSSLVDS